MDRTIAFSAVGILTLVGLGFALSVTRRSSGPRLVGVPTATREAAPTPEPDLKVATVEVNAPPEATPAALLGEAELMEKLREFKGSAPLLSLQLAREGNQRFSNSKDAAERTWHIVKSLSDLGRHDEARQEARRMLELFPHNDFTRDVVRHTLIHPPSPQP